MKKFKSIAMIVATALMVTSIAVHPIQVEAKCKTCCNPSVTETETPETMYMKDFENVFKTMQEKMSAAPVTGNATLDFLGEMIPHHEAAVGMSEAELKYGSNEEVKQIAKNIIIEQDLGIKKMTALMAELEKTTDGVEDDKTYIEAYKQIYDKMVKQMASVEPTGNVDRDFLLQMIPHHEGAIAMAKNILKYTKNQELIEIAKNIAASQDTQLKLMKKLVKSKDL
ncbi:MAG: DUF305 domain-containing protein [Cellulosilyticaceae bacterium]